jgi:2-polyprenyl-6-methoxyphenol hydroxylase-like FAD-dependent oxidoreductase
VGPRGGQDPPLAGGGARGEVIDEVHLPDFLTPPYQYILSLAHPKIHEALLESVTRWPNVAVLRGFKVTDLLRDDGGHATGVKGRHQNQEVTIGARLVAGCDGPSSTVRTLAGIHSEIHEQPYHYLMLTATRHPQQAADWNTEYWTGSGFVGMFPLSGPGWVRCPVEAQPGAMARWRRDGLAALYSELCQWLPRWKEMTLIDHDLHFYKITTHNTPAYVADGVMLLGDAAHTTPPYLGMGMNMGLRDGVIAAKVIQQALKEGTTEAAALKPYEEACRGFAQFVIRASESYESVAAAKHQTHAAVAQALAHSTALDPGVLRRIYEPYE